jgi:hypothetical protein
MKAEELKWWTARLGLLATILDLRSGNVAGLTESAETAEYHDEDGNC